LFDFDDAIWIHSVSEANRRFGFLKNTKKIPKLASLADTVLAGNEYLAAWARQHNSRVVVVPTTVDTERFVPVPREDDGKRPIVIGWVGSPSTLAHFATVVPALARVKERLGERVTFKVIGDPAYREPRLGIVGERWNAATEVADVAQFDLGLMPLPDDEWAKGKCGLKGLQYMAMGIPALLSPVGVNPTLVTPGLDGFLPGSEGEWVATLTALVKDPALRRRVGEAGRKTVVERYSVLRWRQTYEDLIRAAAGRKGARR
jgi:glycosyltransferase involved in cell wall biosynthesis